MWPVPVATFCAPGSAVPFGRGLAAASAYLLPVHLTERLTILQSYLYGVPAVSKH